jgi:hypothetical protein
MRHWESRSCSPSSDGMSAADRCVREHIGWEKFVPSMLQRLIDSNNQYEKVPPEALERAIRRAYRSND